MSAKKWLWLFAAAVAAALLVCALFNVLVDPFGVFGDVLLDWDAYSQTLNPRVGKLEYLEEHHGQYNAYVIGSSSAASYDPELLNQYTGYRFYNLFVYGCDTKDYCELAQFLVENYEVEALVLNLGMNEAAVYNTDHSALTERNHAAVSGESKLGFYLRYAFANPKYAAEKLRSCRADTLLPQSFDVFLPESGCYDKRLRDVEKIGDPERYVQNHGGDFAGTTATTTLAHIADCAGSVAQIQTLCEGNGVELTVIFSPVYETQWQAVPLEEIRAYRSAIAAVTDFWDFGYSSVSLDSRYFYDETHFRNALGNMVLARIFGDESGYLPEDFGRFVTADTLNAALAALDAPVQAEPADYTADVPVLMYHHISDENVSDTVISPEAFRAHMEAIREAGYHTVSVQELYDYVYFGTPLPENPICITLDDGYSSNYTIAWPILQELDMKATVFAIGTSVGHSFYKSTDWAITPHFGYAEAVEMMDSGVISVQSHTYDMHQWAPYETLLPAREVMAPLEGETEEAFLKAIEQDVSQFQTQYYAQTGRQVLALAYPQGAYSLLTEVALAQCGIPITFSTDTDCRNVLVKGLPQTLRALCRRNVEGTLSVQELLAYLEGV